MTPFFVVNGRSANGSTGKRWAALEAQVAEAFPGFGRAFTEGPLHAAALAREAVRAGHDCIVAVGGDGTLNEVTNGLFSEDGQPAAVTLAVLPLGTGGDFGRTFGWKADAHEALRRISSGNTRPFDVGELTYTTHEGAQATRYFANICSFGVSGQVAHEANRTTKALGGKASFMIASLKALAKYDNRDIRISIDGAPAREEADVTTLAVSNGRYFGGGMKVAPDADVSDGLFDITVWSGFGLADFALRQGALYSGEHVTWTGTRRLRCSTISAESNAEVLIDCDGEQPGKLPCSMTVRPSALRLSI